MEHSLLLLAGAVGVAGLLFALAVAYRTPALGPSALPMANLALAILTPIAVFLATLPSRPPFAVGHGLGNGFLIGGFAALLSAAPALRTANRPSESGPTSAAVVTGPWFACVAAVAFSLIWLNGSIIDVLMSIAIGWISVAFVLVRGVGGTTSGSAALPISLGAGFAAAACAAAELATFRGEARLSNGTWMAWTAIGTIYVAGAPLLLLVTSLPSGGYSRLPFGGAMASMLGRLFQTDDARAAAARAWRLVLACALMLGLARLLAWRLAGPPNLFYCAAVGLIAALIGWWLFAGSNDLARDDADSEPRIDFGLALLTVPAAIMAANQLLNGLGAAIAATGVWIAAGAAAISALESGDTATENGRRALSVAGSMLPLGLYATVFALYRLFTTRYAADLRGVTLTDQYAAFGLLVGALTPRALADYVCRNDADRSTFDRLFRLTVSGVFALTIPATLLVLWSARCALAILIGLALGVAIEARPGGLLGSARNPGREASARFAACLFGLASALAIVQWTGHVLPLADLTRAERGHLLLEIGGVVAVAVLLGDLGGRLRSRRAVRSQRKGVA